MTAALLWLLFNLFSIACLAFYSMLEMACISFNKIRLQYYVNKGNQQAIWLKELLSRPSTLFGTTLIGVNIATFVSSECAREFHSALGLNPDLAPLSQVFLVIIFGELAPMFAARHYAENVVMLGMPLIWISSKIMTPFLWILHQINAFCHALIGGNSKEQDIYLSQEEIQRILDEQDGEAAAMGGNEDEIKAVGSNIFKLKTMTASTAMQPISTIPALPSNATVGKVRELLAATNANFLTLYHNTSTHIIGIAWARDLVRAADTKKARDYARAPWFVSSQQTLMAILKQFKRNRQGAAIILDGEGHAVGALDLDDILYEIFGEYSLPSKKQSQLVFIEKTLPATLTIGAFNEQFHAKIEGDEEMQLGTLIQEKLGHFPDKGESIYLAPFEFTVKELSMLEIKTLEVKTRL